MAERKRDYDKEYKEYHGTPEQKKKRAMRNKARREFEKEHGELPPGVDVDHKNPLRKGGSNGKGNTRAQSASKNRGWRKGKKGYDR